mgnify:CR=1 FL=1
MYHLNCPISSFYWAVNIEYQKKILIKTQIKDRYGRTIGVVFLDNQNINNELARQCMAWVYKKYTDNKVLYELEAQAKNRRIGLWVDENPVAPWDWRRGKR